MDAHIKKVYIPMTETGFYILLCLMEENHGYNIVKKVERLTDGEIIISPGTMYGSLSKMEKDRLIRFVREENKRKISNCRNESPRVGDRLDGLWTRKSYFLF